mmetsp:Transcript_75531/g.110650  ORF Transcript_75531/g.110650 Transcript_75531/m.110650 type:complete len:86 (-) Transcript_75531:184-441(-)
MTSPHTNILTHQMHGHAQACTRTDRQTMVCEQTNTENSLTVAYMNTRACVCHTALEISKHRIGGRMTFSHIFRWTKDDEILGVRG